MKDQKPIIRLQQLKRVVIKIGSNVLSDASGIRKDFFVNFAKQIHFLVEHNIHPIVVSSGAIATGMSVLGLDAKPKAIPIKQALAAIGQPLLMQTYAKTFKKYQLSIAQILLTQSSLENRQHFLNAKNAINALLKHHIIPIINENDTVVVEEIKVGDNDQLSAHVANLVNADLLIILSDVAGLYDKNPQQHQDAQLIPVVEKVNKKIFDLIYQSPNQRSTGGMLTKLKAAKIASEYGMPVIITSGFQKNFITSLFSPKFTGTLFQPQKDLLTSRKNWIANVVKPKGQVIIDAGAVQAIVHQQKSLLPSGILEISGKFQIGDCLEIFDEQKNLIAKGLSHYSSLELVKIRGAKTSEIEKILGYKYSDEVVHRDDLVLQHS